MKNSLIQNALTLLFLCFAPLLLQAQKNISEGSISYTAEYDLPADQQMMASMLPKEYKVYFKDELSKFTLDLGMMKNQVISNAKTKTGLMLMEIPMADQKIAVKITAADKTKQQEMMPDYELTKTSETKTISGYKATKYTASDKKSDLKAEVWITPELSTPLNDFTESFAHIGGTPLEFISNMNGVKVKMTFKEIKAEPVTGLAMTVPAGFKEMTLEEMMSMSGN